VTCLVLGNRNSRGGCELWTKHRCVDSGGGFERRIKGGCREGGWNGGGYWPAFRRKAEKTTLVKEDLHLEFRTARVAILKI